uniref:peptidylprolyl isomerase n=1 Tax=Kalanchoe fedtschenkoi TaxID=63787 RepID=A0A7N0TQJ4_KALFE
MKSGERALLHVGWELGYGEKGSFSFPNVPPKADIVYEVELLGFDETEEGKTRGDMTVEERIGAADRRKIDGNTLFKEEKLEEAMNQYEMVLAEDENNAKALFRRGKAKSELGQTEADREDFLKAQEHAPRDKAIARELRILAEQDKAVYQKQKEIYRGLFGLRPAPKPKRSNWTVLCWHWLLALFSRLFKRQQNHKAD